MFKKKQINNIAIDNIKINSLAQIANMKTTNIPINISAAKIFHTLFAFHYKFDLKNPDWIARDRFILSDANANPTYYSTLYLLGLISKNDLENINKPTSNYQNFLAKNNKFGIEISSTKPGYGVAQAVGIAVAEANLSNKFKEVSHFTYAFVSRKDLETGIAQEALKYAGLISLNKLIVLYDSNSFLSNFNVKKTMINNKKTYESYGFKYLKINDANYKSISKAITKAKKSNKPTIIEIKTSLQEMKIINFEGYYSRSSSLSFEQIDEFKDLTNFKKSDLFDCYIDVVNEYKKVFAKNNELFIKWTPSDKLMHFLNENIKENVNDNYLMNKNDLAAKLITIMNNVFDKYKNTIAISSLFDLLTKIKNAGGVHDFNNPEGRKLFLEMKKSAMGLIACGIFYHSNFKPIIFDSLSDASLFIPGLKQAAANNLKMLFIFNNDLNSLKNSNISYQEEEQVAILNQIEGLKILYPADANELAGAIEYYFNKATSPVVIIAKFNSSWNSENTSKANFILGAYYVLKNPSQYTLLAKGNDLQLAYKIAVKDQLNLISISNEDNLDKLNYNKNCAITFTKDIKNGWLKYAKMNLNLNNTNNKVKSDFNLIEKAIKKIIDK